jgi:catechol 2,3-dioxygenase-like lactoylglutathione lyase family enzyme
MAEQTPYPPLIPELQVFDLDLSLAFYQAAGFDVAYERPDERFVMLRRGTVAIMLEEAFGPGRRLGVAELRRPLGRGMNLQIEVESASDLYSALVRLGHAMQLELEDAWYRVGDKQAGQAQFVVADPDGYLLRFFEDLGSREFA